MQIIYPIYALSVAKEGENSQTQIKVRQLINRELILTEE